MHVVAGFESQIAAHGAALAVADAASSDRVTVAGVALARRNAELGIHVDPVRGFALPEHVFAALELTAHRLVPGQTALVVAASVNEDTLARITRAAGLESNGALWVRFVDGD